ncbi:hypothetical protein [Streptomyces scabiei]|uniref:hypothetical protein n=1 Tax=Streptomyces scabiei TaxID=1930 RepID=UPI00117E1456|nr:hypothetical protein [Streptomyces scabiei]
MLVDDVVPRRITDGSEVEDTTDEQGERLLVRDTGSRLTNAAGERLPDSRYAMSSPPLVLSGYIRRPGVESNLNTVLPVPRSYATMSSSVVMQSRSSPMTIVLQVSTTALNVSLELMTW